MNKISMMLAIAVMIALGVAAIGLFSYFLLWVGVKEQVVIASFFTLLGSAVLFFVVAWWAGRNKSGSSPEQIAEFIRQDRIYAHETIITERVLMPSPSSRKTCDVKPLKRELFRIRTIANPHGIEIETERLSPHEQRVPLYSTIHYSEQDQLPVFYPPNARAKWIQTEDHHGFEILDVGSTSQLPTLQRVTEIDYPGWEANKPRPAPRKQVYDVAEFYSGETKIFRFTPVMAEY